MSMESYACIATNEDFFNVFIFLSIYYLKII